MKDTIVARQPIFDTDKNVVAYEIVFKKFFGSLNIKKDSVENNISAEDINDSVDLMEEHGLSDCDKIFITFTADLIKNDVPFLFPADNIAVELAPNTVFDKQVADKIKQLKEKGYLIIMDISVLNDSFNSIINYADIINIDFKTSSDINHKNIIKTIRSKFKNDLKFTAKNINEYEDFNHAVESGYNYMQGFFFTKPDLIAGREIPGYKVNYVNVLKELNKEDVDFNEIENIIKNDISMSFSLLSTINAASYGYKISSIKQASTMLGVKGLRKWSLLYLVKGLSSDKADILFVNTLTRAKFAELLAEEFDIKDKKPELFTMGIFSMMDTFLNRSLYNILKDIPLTEDIKDALLIREGVFGEILSLVIAFERQKWNQISLIEKINSLNSKKLYNNYVKAVDFAYETMDILMEAEIKT